VKRKAISKKLRFEIFKRDKFTCQYCGVRAPDVVLQCDHVEPVVRGGETTALNLVTSCIGCNAGKGSTRLDDATALAKQREELQRLAERREQVQMLLAWHRELSKSADCDLDALATHWHEVAVPYKLNARGLDEVRKYLRTFGLAALLAAIDVSVCQYIKRDETGNATGESALLAWSKVPGIARISNLPQAEKDLYYARGILRNRLPYIDERECMRLLREASNSGVQTCELKQLVRAVDSWGEFCREIVAASERNWRARA
jgi:HNH endonuclease